MPVNFMTFRSVCGCFLPKFNAFMERRRQSSVAMRVKSIRISTCSVSLAVVFVIATLLRLAGDVELNPGPDSEETLLAAINRIAVSNEKTTAALQQQVSSLSETVKLQGQSITQQIDNNHKELYSEVSRLNAEIGAMGEAVQDNRADIDRLARELELTNSRLAKTERALDKQEAFSRRNNVKLIGVTESESDSYTECAHAVVDLLNRFYVHKTWSTTDIERAHRLGSRRDVHGSGPRPLIVRFHRWEDKMQLLRDTAVRSSMRDSGVKVAADLTTYQQSELKRVKAEGKYGYYKGGKLFIEDSRTVISQTVQQPREKVDRRGEGEMEAAVGASQDSTCELILDRTLPHSPHLCPQPVRGPSEGMTAVGTCLRTADSAQTPSPSSGQGQPPSASSCGTASSTRGQVCGRVSTRSQSQSSEAGMRTIKDLWRNPNVVGTKSRDTKEQRQDGCNKGRSSQHVSNNSTYSNVVRGNKQKPVTSK